MVLRKLTYSMLGRYEEKNAINKEVCLIGMLHLYDSQFFFILSLNRSVDVSQQEDMKKYIKVIIHNATVSSFLLLQAGNFDSLSTSISTSLT